MMSSQQFIGALIKKYKCCKSCIKLTTQTFHVKSTFTKPKHSFADHIRGPSNPSNNSCATCGLRNHVMNNFFHKDKTKCSKCGRFNHAAKESCLKEKQKEEEQSGDGNKRTRKNQVYMVSRNPQENEPNNPDTALTTTIDPITGKLTGWPIQLQHHTSQIDATHSKPLDLCLSIRSK